MLRHLDTPDYPDLLGFGTLRQLGSGAALAARFTRWLDRHTGGELERAAAGFDAVSAGAKRLIFKCARAAATGKPGDGAGTLSEMSSAWRDSLTLLDNRLPH